MQPSSVQDANTKVRRNRRKRDFFMKGLIDGRTFPHTGIGPYGWESAAEQLRVAEWPSGPQRMLQIKNLDSTTRQTLGPEAFQGHSQNA
ncbi:hypothetical protein A4V15_11640 [Pseudomonas oryzihabitans]|uniref:Uncharacterized protein n=1 Tax=Pseudomonas oryzihabitans TaxID=47885 RepID=A0A178LMF7_9PSED|nr:hypothetical protein A4V15_11640 [Pseudomonas oryzihabitans]